MIVDRLVQGVFGAAPVPLSQGSNGIMLALMMAGRIGSRIDPRALVMLLRQSMWPLADQTPAIDDWTLSINTIVQGGAIGFVFVPLSVVAFGTLPARCDTQGRALISLSRIAGGAVGISIFQALQTNDTAVEHSVPAPIQFALEPDLPQCIVTRVQNGARCGDARSNHRLRGAGEFLQQR